MNILVGLIPLGIMAVVVVIYVVFPRMKGFHYTSRLVCPRCLGEFDYNWLPGGAFDAIRFGKYRFMPCQICGQWSWFDILSTARKDD